MLHESQFWQYKRTRIGFSMVISEQSRQETTLRNNGTDVNRFKIGIQVRCIRKAVHFYDDIEVSMPENFQVTVSQLKQLNIIKTLFSSCYQCAGLQEVMSLLNFFNGSKPVTFHHRLQNSRLLDKGKRFLDNRIIIIGCGGQIGVLLLILYLTKQSMFCIKCYLFENMMLCAK